MKIAFLSAASSIHTIRWVNGLGAAGVEVHLISQQPLLTVLHKNVRAHLFPDRGMPGYFLMASPVRKLLKQLQPDLVNAHYASGYGTTARLVNYRPWLLSVWGSDVFEFPNKSPLHKWWVSNNLKTADAVASTSHCMAEQTRSLLPQLQDIATTPFGVDIQAFSLHIGTSEPRSSLTIGTVKALKPIYGIDTLIRAFAKLKHDLLAGDCDTAQRLRLRIVGDGPQMKELEQLAESLKIAPDLDFVGHVPHTRVPQELAALDIYVALSRSESFGVAAIEAGAAGLPVVVSDAGGLPEVVLAEQTGLVVPKDNPDAAAAALLRLVQDRRLRLRLGAAGQQHVAARYSWPACVQTMIDVYQKTISDYRLRS